MMKGAGQAGRGSRARADQALFCYNILMAKPIIKKLTGWKPKTTSEKLALRLVKILHSAGFKQTFVVGGYVRDSLLGRSETGAIDLATEATPVQVSRLLQKKKFKVIPTGIAHGTVTAHKGSDDIEITTFRKEGRYLDFRRPAKVNFIKDPKIDSSRRDFTVNAFYFDPREKQILDFQGGFADLASKTLRFIGKPEKRISEDALRLIRAVRFVAVLDFKVPKADATVVKKYAKLILKIAPERIKQELDKIVLSSGRVEGLRLLHRLRLLRQIMPEVERMIKTPQSKNYHSEGNVFVHTMLALSLLEEGSDLKTCYGLLFHDIGKTVTAHRTTRDGRPHVKFYGHQPEGVKITEKVLKRLRFSNDEIQDITWYVKNHHVPFEIKKMRTSKQMAWCLDFRFENLLKIFRADTLASIPTDSSGRQLKPSLDTYEYARKLLKKACSQKVLRQRLISGHDVMKIFGIPEGPKVGEVLRKSKDLQLGGKIKTRQEALKRLKSWKV